VASGDAWLVLGRRLFRVARFDRDDFFDRFELRDGVQRDVDENRVDEPELLDHFAVELFGYPDEFVLPLGASLGELADDGFGTLEQALVGG
jgi:hypothetical protein